MTKIEWTDATWNPIVGCSVTSPGCTNCYAMKMGGRLEGMAATNASLAHYVGTTQRSKAGFVWTGKVNMAPDSILTAPLRRRKPTRYFVNSMADLFHESVPAEWIDRVFAVMALAPQHTFQVLTKRSARMRDYCQSRFETEWGSDALCEAIESIDNFQTDAGGDHDAPLPNVWLGVSVEDQTRADERIPDLLATPAAVRFLSCEPLLGPVDLRAIPWPEHWPRCECLQGDPRYDAFEATVYCPSCCEGPEAMDAPTLDWVIAGGESGPGARPMHPDWARSLRDQCQSAGVPFFFKQWGEWVPVCGAVDAWDIGDDPEQSRFKHRDWENDKWGDAYFPAWCDETADDTVFRLGKARAGRLLDGREWSEFPA